MPINLNEEIEWDDEPDVNLMPTKDDEDIEWDLEPDQSIMDTEPMGIEDQFDQVKFDVGAQPTKVEEPTIKDPDDIWSDASFTGEKPIDEGPSWAQRIIPAVGAAAGGPFATAQIYAATGAEPYRGPRAQSDDFEGMKGLIEQYKGMAKSAARSLGLITKADADIPSSDDYDLENPLDRSNYYWDLVQSKAFNTANESLGPIFNKVAELEELQPDVEYFSRLQEKPTFTKYMEEIIGMAPQVATQLAAYVVGGPVGSSIWMALQIAGSEYDSMIEKGADPARAEQAAWGSALSQAPFEALSLGFILHNPISRRLVKGGIVYFGLNRMLGGATEWITETVQNIPAKFWENWAQDPDYIKKLQKNPKLIKSLVAQGFKEGMSEGNVAAFYGAITGIGGDVKAKRKAKARPELGKAAREALSGLEADFKEGTLTADDIETMKAGKDADHPFYAELDALLTGRGEAEPAAGERLERLEAIATSVFKEKVPEIFKVDPEAVKNKNVRSVSSVAKALGMDVVFYQSKGTVSGLNGLVDVETGQIYINEGATDPHLTVVGHESLHRLKAEHPDLYDKLVDKVVELDVDITDYLNQVNTNRKAAGLSEITAGQALSTEEYIADFVGHQFASKDFWNKLHKKDAKLGKQLAKIVSDLIEAVKAAMRKEKSIDPVVFKKMNAAQDALADVYSEFARRETKIKDTAKPKPAKPAQPKVDKAAIEAKLRAADMPNALEYDHIVKGLTFDQRKAAADVLEAYDMPIKDRVAALKKAVGIGQARAVQPVAPQKDLENLTNEEIAGMTPQQRAKAVLGEDAPQEQIDALVKQIEAYEKSSSARKTPEMELSNLIGSLDKEQASSVKDLIKDTSMPAKERLDLIRAGLLAYDEKQAKAKKVKKPKQSKAGLNVRTFRGAVLARGGIKWGDQFKGERKDMPLAIKMLTRQKTGMPWDTLEKALRDDGWLGPDEDLLDALTDEAILKRGRLGEDLLTKKTGHLTEQEREVKKEIEHEAEEPPPGDYQVMNAEDLPMGKKLTLIEGESTRGWDVYEVVEKDPFGITLKDGVIIELSPFDKVQVRKMDIAASAKKPKPKPVPIQSILPGFKNQYLKDVLTMKIKPDAKSLASKLTTKEFDALNESMGFPISGTKQERIDRFMKLYEIRDRIKDYAATYEGARALSHVYKRADLYQMAKDMKGWKSGNKLQLAASLLSWRDRTRYNGIGRIISSFEASGRKAPQVFVDAKHKKIGTIGAEKKAIKYSPKAYKDLDKDQKNAFNRASRNIEGLEDTRQRIREHEGSAWEQVAISSVLTRQAMEDLLKGKPVTYDNPLNGSKMRVVKNGILKKGENWIWNRLKTKLVLGKPKKPTISVSGSFAACNPSKKCADICYASKGRRYDQVFWKSEVANWAIQKDPIRTAQLAAQQYRAMVETKISKALRMFDRGESEGPAWVTFINELNKQGVRTQIFSKKPDFLRSVSDMNIRLLSIDSSNTDLADANPDLDLSVIYEGEQDVDMLEKYRGQIEGRGVILPVIAGKKKWNEADIAKIPAWGKDSTCPIDAGTKKIGKGVGEWNCTKCDSGDGLPGCFFEKSTARVLGQIPLELTYNDVKYRIKDLKKFGKEIPDAGIRKQFYENLDLLVSEIRGGSDPGATTRSEGGFFEVSEGSQGGVSQPGKQGTGKPTPGTISDEDLEISEGEKAKFSAKFKKPGQMGLPIFARGDQIELDFGDKAIEVKLEKPKAKPAAEVAKKPAKKVKRDKDRIQDRKQRTRMVSTGWIGSSGRVVRNVDEATSLVSHIRKSAQEQAYLVATDKKGLVLEVQKYSKGLTSSASIDPVIISAHLMNIKGAKTAYFIHNHPSIDPGPSPEDVLITDQMSQVASLKNIEVKPSIIGGTTYYDMTTGRIQDITPVLRNIKLPIKERFLARAAGFKDIKAVSNSTQVKEYIKKVHKETDGFLFFNAKLIPVGFLPMRKTNMKALAAEVLKAQESLNASTFMFHSKDRISSHPGRGEFLQNLTKEVGGHLQLMEVIEAGMSHADAGSLRQFKQAQSMSPKLGKLGTETPVYSPKKAPPFYSQMQKALDAKLPNKGSADNFRQTIDALVKKNEFKSEELEWSGLDDFFEEQGDKKIKKADLLNWLKLNALELEEVRYYRDTTTPRRKSPTQINWPADTGDHYKGTWTNLFTKKEHKFEIEKITLGTGIEKTDFWMLSFDGEPVEQKTEEDEAISAAYDYADDIFENSITDAAQVSWESRDALETDDTDMPIVYGSALDPISQEYVEWSIEKVEDPESQSGYRYQVSRGDELWDDGAYSLAEGQLFVQQEFEDAIWDQIESLSLGEESLVDEPMHEHWVLPSGENYQELLLKLPEPDSARRKALIAQFEQKYGGLYGIDFRYEDLTTQEREDITEAAREADRAIREKKVFTHPHWSEPNVLAHTRMTDRVDSKGRKTLFLEEVQSDWHQAGRKKGYRIEKPKIVKTEKPGKDLAAVYEAIYTFEDGIRIGANSMPEAILQWRMETESKYPVPNAPFKKTWPMLVIKRMVRWAANEGYDAIGWTPGIVQVERYEETLRQKVDKFLVNKREKGLKGAVAYVTAHKDNNIVFDHVIPLTGTTRIQNTQVDLEDIVGKEIADKIRKDKSGKQQVFEGDDLTIGGEGMKAFYDRILKNEVNKFFNKKTWGNAHVEIDKVKTETEIGEDITPELLDEAAALAEDALDRVSAQALSTQADAMRRTGEYSSLVFNPNPWPDADRPPSHYLEEAREFKDKHVQFWTLPITPQMREKALYEGMPLFSVKKAMQIPHAGDVTQGDYRVKFSAKEDHPAHQVAKDFSEAHPGYVVRFDGEWDRSEIDMDPMYQFTITEGTGKGYTFTAENMDPEEIETKFYKILTPFTEKKAVMMAKKRIDPLLQSYIDALKAAQPEAFITSPDIKEDPAKGLPKEIADRLNASRGLGRLSMMGKLKDTLKEIWKSSTRHRPYLDPKEYPDVSNVLRIHQEVPGNSVRRAGQVLSAIMGGLKPNQYKVFAHKLLIDDMLKDVESGLLADPENLPFGFDIKTARAYLEKLNDIVASDPIIEDAIKRRTAFNKKLKRALVNADLLPKAVMEDDRYFHHQVLQYRAVKEIGGDYFPGIGVSSKDVRLKKKGWQRGRIGSWKDYNSDYAESEFEVIAQAIAQLETKATMERLKDLSDIMPGLKTEAKSQNLHNLYVKEARRLSDADSSGRTWKYWEVQEEADPLSPFRAEIGKGLSWIGDLAKKFKLENGSRDFTDVLEALEEWQLDVGDEKARAKDEGRDPYPVPFPFDELGSRAWAYFNHMMKENLPGAPAAGIIFRAIRQRDQFIKDYLGKDFLKPTDIMPDDHTVWKPAPGSSWYKAHSLPDRIVDAVQAGEMVIGPENAEKIKQVLARGRDVEWIIPTDVAKTLDGYDVKYEDHMLSTASRKMMTGWKQWILINPYRVVKYNVNNMSGDLDISLAYDPKIVFKYLPRATKDLYRDWQKKELSPELKAEIDLANTLGVIGSGWSVQEVADVTRELSYGEHMQALTGEKPALVKRGWRFLQGFTNYRENILRLAAFRYFQARLAAGDKNIYAASNKAEIDGVKDNTEKAAKLARELIGDYGNITHSGQWIRRHLIPFYAWMEINAPRYVRLMRNLKHEGQGAKRIGRALPLVSKSIAWKGTKLAMKASAIYVLANLWNRAFFPDEDDELGEAQRRQLHVILGRRDDGSIISLRFQGALSDALSWFGGEDIHKDIEDIYTGKKTAGEYAKETALAAPIKIIGGIRPDVKAGAEVLAGQSFYPDPFNPRPIYDKLEHVTRLFSLNGAYKWLAGKPKRGDTTGERLLNDLMALGFYNSDPGESAYYDIKSKTYDYLDKKGVERPSVTPTSKSKALYYYKQALKFGDLKAAEKYLAKYMELGGKETGISSSFKRAHPLGSLPKKDHRAFLQTLTEEEKERYELALGWYRDTYLKRRHEVAAPSRSQKEIDGGQPGENVKTLRNMLKTSNQQGG